MERRITQRVSPKMKKRKVAWLGVALVSLVFSTGWSQTPPPPDFVPGELVLTARPGVLLEKVREIASLANAEVKPIPVPDTYLLRLRGQEGRSVEQIKQSTLQAVESLRSKSEVLYIRPNWLYKPAETTPNDPLYYLQWALPMLNMPKAWDIEKGKDAIRIAVIDTHFLINHPDLTGRFDLNLSRDFTVDPPDNDPSPPAGVLDSHGTAVSSVIIASTDNGEGMAGLCWEGVQVVAMRTVESDERGLPYANILKAYRHVLDNVDKIHVVNMSYGILGYADPQEQAMLREMSDRGVILVAAAGNHGNSLPSYPAAHPFVLSIGALGPNKTKASYSATGDPNLGSKIDFAAPGGDILTRWEEGIVAASPKSSGWGVITEGYEFVQGTSFASPYAAAAIGLMLSADIDKADIVPILQETADPLGKVPPSSEYGYGLINVFAALTGSGISVAIENPTKGKVFEVLKVPFQAIIKARLQGGAQPEITLKLDGEVIPPEKWQKCLTTVNERTKRFDMVLRFPPPPLGEISQQHTLEVIATAQDSQGKTIQSRDSSNFTIQVHQQLGGLNMFSIPYEIRKQEQERTEVLFLCASEDRPGTGEIALPEELFGSQDPKVDFVLARWIPDSSNPAGGAYAFYSKSGERDPRASFNPPGVQVRPDRADATPTPPRGLGYFLLLKVPSPPYPQPRIVSDDPVDNQTAYLIPLEPADLNSRGGWNLIGNPFPYPVDWNVCEVEVIGDGGIPQRLSLQEAIARDYIRAQIYHYDLQTGQYSWRTAPLGQLLPWAGHWVKALKRCTLVVPPLPSQQRSVKEERNRAVLHDSWMLRLIARSGDREDRNNFIGWSRSATDPVGAEDVEEPPGWQSYLSLRLLPPTTKGQAGGIALAQDLRRWERKPKQWELEVSTDQPGATVTLQWSQETPMPKGVRLTLEDSLTGQRISMKAQSTYTFRMAQNATARRFRILAQPDHRGQLLISNVQVIPTRGKGYAIRYALTRNAQVQVQITGVDGRPLANLTHSSRSAGVNSVTWNGRTSEGIMLPPGNYLVKIIATNEEGEMARVVRPLILTR